MKKKKKESEKPSTKPPDYIFGRPTLYRPEYCKMLIDHMASGLSFESFSAVADVTISTLYEWEKNRPDFSEAKKAAFGKNLLFWEKKGVEGLHDETEYNEDGKLRYKKSINSTVWIFNMKNRHRWKDKQEDEVTKVIINPVHEVLSNLSADELLALVKDKKE